MRPLHESIKQRPQLFEIIETQQNGNQQIQNGLEEPHSAQLGRWHVN